MGTSIEPLLSIVYASTASPGFDTVDLAELLSEARAKNRAVGVTGMLLAEHGRFLQALEGAEPVVRGLMRTIESDPRHVDVRVLAEQVVHARRFPDWSMAHGRIGDLEALPLAQYAEALEGVRRALPAPPGRRARIAAWFRGGSGRRPAS